MRLKRKDSIIMVFEVLLSTIEENVIPLHGEMEYSMTVVASQEVFFF